MAVGAIGGLGAGQARRSGVFGDKVMAEALIDQPPSTSTSSTSEGTAAGCVITRSCCSPARTGAAGRTDHDRRRRQERPSSLPVAAPSRLPTVPPSTTPRHRAWRSHLTPEPSHFFDNILNSCKCASWAAMPCPEIGVTHRCKLARGSPPPGSTRPERFGRAALQERGHWALSRLNFHGYPILPVMYDSVRASSGFVKIWPVSRYSTRLPRWKKAVFWLTRAACCIECVTMTTE